MGVLSSICTITFRCHDTSIYVECETGDLRPLWHRVMNLCADRGFTVIEDPRIVKDYKCLRRYSRYGQCKQLEFKSEVCGLLRTPSHRFSLEFYQNVRFENRNGGRYDFHKRARMPYLIGKRFEWIRNEIAAFLRTQGASELPNLNHGSALERIANGIRKNGHFRGGDPLLDWVPRYTGYNVDRDKKPLMPGQVKYFYSVRGHLQRGVVYYDLNDRWYVWLNAQEVGHVSAYECFDWRPCTPRRRPTGRRPKLESALRRAVKELDFERAAKLRDLLGLKSMKEAA